MARRLFRRLASAAFAALLMAPAVAAEAPRVALVIGNGEYELESWYLDNPVNDARLMAKALGRLGFSVDLKENVSNTDMRKALAKFGAALSESGPDTVGLFYFAGHGVQSGGFNYLMPTDSNARTEQQVWAQGLILGDVLNQMAGAKNAANLVILDACRDNPLPSQARAAPGAGGFARPSGLPNVLIAFATAPGATAADSGGGANSPYTAELAEVIESREPVTLVLERVAARVYQKTGGVQRPWYESGLVLESPLILGRAQDEAPRPPAPPPPDDQGAGGELAEDTPPAPAAPALPPQPRMAPIAAAPTPGFDARVRGLVAAVPFETWPTDFAFYGPGDLEPGSGEGARDRTIYAPDMIFPVQGAPAFLNSQVHRPGGPIVGKSQCDPINYSYPWRDNFCETRSSARRATLNCPKESVHQGVDIRAGTPELCRFMTQEETAKHRLFPVVAVEDGVISYVGAYTVSLRAEGREHRYLNMNMKELKVAQGQEVKAGDVLGYLSNDFGGNKTTVHLHFEMKMNIDGVGWTWVSPYTSLVAAYERMVGRGREVVEGGE